MKNITYRGETPGTMMPSNMVAKMRRHAVLIAGAQGVGCEIVHVPINGDRLVGHAILVSDFRSKEESWLLELIEFEPHERTEAEHRANAARASIASCLREKQAVRIQGGLS